MTGVLMFAVVTEVTEDLALFRKHACYDGLSLKTLI